MSEESYVVRIYRQEQVPRAARRAQRSRRSHDRVAIAGVVEAVESSERHNFRDIEELWAILSTPPRPQTGRRASEDTPEN
jgi:hypothetical protein